MVYQIDEQWQIDLVDMSEILKHNDGVKFIMVIIDILSKYAWLEPLKSKHGITIKMQQSIFLARVIQTDKGTEFLNVLVKNHLQNKNIKLFATHSEQKARIIERLNRTINGTMFRYFTKKNARKHTDILSDITSKHNYLIAEVSKWFLKILKKIKKLKYG